MNNSFCSNKVPYYVYANLPNSLSYYTDKTCFEKHDLNGEHNLPSFKRYLQIYCWDWDLRGGFLFCDFVSVFILSFSSSKSMSTFLVGKTHFMIRLQMQVSRIPPPKDDPKYRGFFVRIAAMGEMTRATMAISVAMAMTTTCNHSGGGWSVGFVWVVLLMTIFLGMHLPTCEFVDKTPLLEKLPGCGNSHWYF